jgi:hypothetical protein
MKPLIFLWFCWCVGAMAADHKIVCPMEIKRDTIRITSAPAGWTPLYLYELEPGLPLNGAGLMWGPPLSMTMSKPSWSGKVDGRNAERWTDLGGMESGEKWMACYYGERGQHDAILSKQIDAGATECTVTYTKAKRVPLDIVCK